jgi:hypothetical protein
MRDGLSGEFVQHTLLRATFILGVQITFSLVLASF